MTASLPRRPNAALVLGVLLCVNPVTLLLVGSHPTVAALVPLIALLVTQGLWWRFGARRVTIYVVNFIALGGIWLNAEAVIRARYHDYVIEDLYTQHGQYYSNRPYLRSRLTDKEYAVDYLTNRQGFRIGYSQDVERTVGSVDWLFLGDSYTQGAQVDFEQLYTSLLYRRFPDRTILNVGISGWGLFEALAFLKARGASLRPSVVFVQISNFNDFMKVSPRRATLSDYLMQYSQAVRLVLQEIKYVNPTDLPLGRWVEPFYATDDENRRFNVFYRRSSPEKENDLEQVAIAVQQLARLTKQLGARLVLIQVPTKEQVSFRFLEEVVAGLRMEPQLLDMEYPNRMIRRLADSLGLRLIDLLDEWRTASTFPFFEYDEHLTPQGHAMLADAVAKTLLGDGEQSSVRILSTSYAGDRYPQFVHSGDTIVFHSPRDGNFELLEADISTWTERRLTIDDAPETHPVVLPDGNGLVFVVGDAERGTTRIWRSDRHGGRPIPLYPDSNEYAGIPAVTPSGDALVFPAWGPDPNSRAIRLTLLRLRDGHREVLPQTNSNIWRPTVHPNGRHVAYIGQVDGQFDIFELDLETRVTKRLTTTAYDEWDPAYSPDGSMLVYAARVEGNWDLMALERQSNGTRRLTRTRGDEWDPQVAPDGKSIAYGGEYGLMRGIYFMPFPR